MPAATLVSITVTPPTKIEYDTHDTALDLDGMVVTANYSDSTSKAIAAGYTVSTPDFTQLGSQDITVTYQGFTDKFTINVSEWVNHEWDEDLAAGFSLAFYGYVPPYFNTETLGLGATSINDWRYAEDEDEHPYEFFLLGTEEIAEPAPGAASPLKPIADLYIADGFVASAVPDPTAASPTYWYILEKVVDDNGTDRYIRVRIAMIADLENGAFTSNGVLFFEISDAYFYSWESAGFEEEIKKGLDFIDDIPDFPAGVRFARSDKLYFDDEAAGSYASFTVYGVNAAYVDAYLGVLDTAGWDTFYSTRENYDIEAISPDEKARIAFDFDSAKGELSVYIDESPVRPEMVSKIAAIFNVSPFAFTYSKDNENFYYQFNNETLGDGEDWGTLIDKYAAILTADADSNFVKKGERTKVDEAWYDKYVDAALGIQVTIFGYDTKTAGKYGVQITVDEYVEVPEDFIPVMNLLGIDPDDVSMTPATDASAEYASKQIKFPKETAYADALKTFTDILDADTTLGYTIIYPLNDATMTSGEAAKHIEYANSNVRVEFLSWTSTTETIVQIRFFHYTPAPTSQFLDTVLSVLSDFTISWDDEDQSFRYVAYRPTTGKETLNGVVKKYVNKLIKDDYLESLELDKLVEYEASANAPTTADKYPEAKTILSCDEGSIEIKYSYGFTVNGNQSPVFFIIIRPFDTSVDSVVNDVAALTGVTMTKDAHADNIYSGVGQLLFAGMDEEPLSLQKYGENILTMVLAEDLQNSSLGFGAMKSGKMEGNNYVGHYTNSKGYEVTFTVYGDAERNYNGYYRVTVTIPQA